MKYLLLCSVILFISCTNYHEKHFPKETNNSLLPSGEHYIDDVIEVAVSSADRDIEGENLGTNDDSRSSNNDSHIELLRPLWTYKNNSFLVSDGNSILYSDRETVPWSYLQFKFFSILGSSFFKLNKYWLEDINFTDLFKSEIIVSHEFRSLKQNIDFEGTVNFYEGRLHYLDEYERNRLWLNFYHSDNGGEKKIFSKKMVEGENYFFFPVMMMKIDRLNFI